MTADPYHLDRFVAAQSNCYASVVRELASGRKQSHWMWFVFPQMKGLGQSAMSEHYGISRLDEARAYLAHPTLGPRLVACTELTLAARPQTAEQIFGFPDDLKFQSSLTLFSAAATGTPVFDAALAAFFGGAHDAKTMRLLGTTG